MSAATQIREELAGVELQRAALDRRRWTLIAAREEAEGRPDSQQCRFARAALAGDYAAMESLRIEGLREYRGQFGHFPEDAIYEKAAKGTP